jgi:hypothetical protein
MPHASQYFRYPDNHGFQAQRHVIHPNPHVGSGGSGGIVFAGPSESHTPSPAPHPTHGAFIPPPPLQVNNEDRRANGHGHVQSGSSGFPGPIETHFRPDMPPVSSIDAYGPGPAHVPFESFAPGASRYGPPTPHSLHGSHASGEPNGIENGNMRMPSIPPHFPPPSNMNYLGQHHPHPSGHFAPFPPGQFPFKGRHGAVEEELLERVDFFRSQFDNKELSDCVLELVYTSGRFHPVKIAGHSLVLSQSSALKHSILAARTKDHGNHTITIETDDLYIRSDSWWMAVQRLYLHPLLNLPPSMGNGVNAVDFAGNKIDRFEFCLGYAASGYLLNLHDVLVRGLHIAADLLTWYTIEHALGFVLHGTIRRHTDYGMEQDTNVDAPFVEVEFGYGPETKILLDAVISFLINAFPPNFEFDSSVIDPPQISRLPNVPASHEVSSPTSTSTPTMSRGTNMRANNKPTRLGSIKFGDLPAAYPEEGPVVPQREPAPCSPILSRVLLNLPFDELRVVLTSESSGESGWNTAHERYHVVSEVVAAREARRLRAVEAVRDGMVPHSREIRQRLSAHRRQAFVEPWDVLNWQEEVIHPSGSEQAVPRVVRRWVSQFSEALDLEATEQVGFRGPESMV